MHPFAPRSLSPTASARRVFIVDDHPVTRRGLAALVVEHLGMEVCGETDNAADALVLIRASSPDLALIDISLRDTNGLALVKELHHQNPSLLLLVVSMYDEDLYAEPVLRAGARGFIMKQEAGDELCSAVRTVLQNEIYLSDRMKTRMRPNGLSRSRRGEFMFPMESLSQRELQVFRLLGEGMNTREIAETLEVSTKTIDAHRNRLKLKLGLESATDLVPRAVQWARAEAEAQFSPAAVATVQTADELSDGDEIGTAEAQIPEAEQIRG